MSHKHGETKEQNIARAKELFKTLRDRDPQNKICFECTESNPQWASLSYGVMICLVCSGVHRSLGVHLSFVRSLTMDTWTDQQLEKMKAGGNGRGKAYFREHGLDGISIKDKYNTKAASVYRDMISAEAEGKEYTPPADRKSGSSAASHKSSPKSEPKPPKKVSGWDDDDWDVPKKSSGSGGLERKERNDFDDRDKEKEREREREKNRERERERESQRERDRNTSDRSKISGGTSYNSNNSNSSNSSYSSGYSASRSNTGGIGYNSGNSLGGYNGDSTERLSHFSNARSISSADFYGESSAPTRSSSSGYNSSGSGVDYGMSLIGEGLSKLGTVAKTVGAVATAGAEKISEQARELSSNIQEKGLLNEVSDLTSKTTTLVSQYWSKARESIGSGGNESVPLGNSNSTLSSSGGFGNNMGSGYHSPQADTRKSISHSNDDDFRSPKDDRSDRNKKPKEKEGRDKGDRVERDRGDKERSHKSSKDKDRTEKTEKKVITDSWDDWDVSADNTPTQTSPPATSKNGKTEKKLVTDSWDDWDVPAEKTESAESPREQTSPRPSTVSSSKNGNGNGKTSSKKSNNNNNLVDVGDGWDSWSTEASPVQSSAQNGTKREVLSSPEIEKAPSDFDDFDKKETITIKATQDADEWVWKDEEEATPKKGKGTKQSNEDSGIKRSTQKKAVTTAKYDGWDDWN